MFSTAITAALERHASDRIRYYEQQIEFFKQKEADPQLEELAYHSCKYRFYLFQVEETHAIVIRDLRRKIEILNRRTDEGFVLDNFICQKCRQGIVSVTRVIREPECTWCEACYFRVKKTISHV